MHHFFHHLPHRFLHCWYDGCLCHDQGSTQFLASTLQTLPWYFINDSGAVDSMSFVGRTLGSCFLLFVYIRRQKLTYTIQSIVHSLMLFLVFAFIYDVSNGVAKFLLLSSMLISGFFRGFLAIPRIIFVNACDPIEDKF